MRDFHRWCAMLAISLSAGIAANIPFVMGDDPLEEVPRKNRLRPSRQLPVDPEPKTTTPAASAKPATNPGPTNSTADRTEKPSGRAAAGPKPRPQATLIEFEILTAGDSGALTGQQWRAMLEELDVGLRIRRGTSADKIETREYEQGSIRRVNVVGQLDRSGTLIVDGRQFKQSDGRLLKEWIDELKTYGAQGTPEKQPLWGLSPLQFEQVFAGLSLPVTEDVVGKEFHVATQQLPLPEEFPLRWSTAAEKQNREAATRVYVRQQIRGLTLGTALAITLQDFGLVMRPSRKPDGQIELVIEPAGHPQGHWPIGWPMSQPRTKWAPALFSLRLMEVRGQSLAAVLARATKETEVPVYLDGVALKAQGVDLETLEVTVPRRQATWSTTLRTALAQGRLVREFWEDEQGQPFVWVTQQKSARAKGDGESTGP